MMFNEGRMGGVGVYVSRSKPGGEARLCISEVIRS